MQESQNPFVIAKCESFCSCIYFFVNLHKRVYQYCPHGLRSIGVAEWTQAVGAAAVITGAFTHYQTWQDCRHNLIFMFRFSE